MRYLKRFRTGISIIVIKNREANIGTGMEKANSKVNFV